MQMPNADMLKHSDMREVGAEWMCYYILLQLVLDKILKDNNFRGHEVLHHPSLIERNKQIGNTQKIITISGFNKPRKEIIVHKILIPNPKLKALEIALNVRHRPLTKLKSVVHKQKLKKLENQIRKASVSS